MLDPGELMFIENKEGRLDSRQQDKWLYRSNAAVAKDMLVMVILLGKNLEIRFYHYGLGTATGD